MRHCMAFSFVTFAIATSYAGEIPLTSLDLSHMRQGYGKPQVNRSVTEKPLQIAGKTFETGVGTHSPAKLYIELDGKAEKFDSWVGLDDGSNERGSVVFQVLVDGKKVFDSGEMRKGTPAKQVQVPLEGAKVLLLKVDNAGDSTQFDHADFGEAKIMTNGGAPKTIPNLTEPQFILTPKPGPEPKINAPSVYGCRPGNPFLYRIPATGTRPMEFVAEGLPEGLTLDAANGIISGTTPAKGDYTLTLQAKNDSGEARKPFTIKVGDKLSLTPYMGWNHWYAHYTRITDKRMREAADAIVSNGMADFGYDYVAIDDCWARKPGSDDPMLMGDPRDERGNIIPNKHFPDMSGLTDYIHSKGLKAGIYSSPGPLTCTSYAGSFEHEALDAKQYADWGFDLLKYDWCSYGKSVAGKSPDLAAMKKPYELMGPLVKQQKRDIIFNLCQYGMGEVWRWGADIEGHSWRTSGDLGYALDRIIEVAAKNVEHRSWNGPGRWNDPDYLQIGFIGDIKNFDEDKLIPSPLTPNEQYSFMSLWCLMASPLVYSGDVTQMDEFTLNVLCNAEAIEVNQDPLGQCAAMADLGDDAYLLVKDMADGSKAIGLCNGSESSATLKASWSALGVQGKYVVRDLWRQKDLGVFDDSYEVEVPRHGTAFLRLRKAN